MRLSKLKEWAYTPSSIMESNDNVDTGRYEFLKQVNWYSNPVVKVSNWEYPLLSLPYDNITQNQKISQYNRLGFSNEDNLISVSREAQMQVFENTVKQPKHKYCPMLNLITYPTTMSARREEIRRLNNLICDNLCTNLVDYRSTTHTDYPTPYPFIGKHYPREECLKVEKKYGRTTMHPCTAIVKPGYNKFMDEEPDDYYALKKQPRSILPYNLHFPPEETWKRIRQDRHRLAPL